MSPNFPESVACAKMVYTVVGVVGECRKSGKLSYKEPCSAATKNRSVHWTRLNLFQLRLILKGVLLLGRYWYLFSDEITIPINILLNFKNEVEHYKDRYTEVTEEAPTVPNKVRNFRQRKWTC